MFYNMYDILVFYSQYFHQHVSAAIPAIFREILLQVHKSTNLVNCEDDTVNQTFILVIRT
jgi:hypothetical protein